MTLAIEPLVAGDGGEGAAHALRGPLSFTTAAAAHALGIRLLSRPDVAAAAGRDGLVLDAAGVTAADSAGLAVLLDWRREALRRGIRLRYRNLPESLQRLARISSVESMLTG